MSLLLTFEYLLDSGEFLLYLLLDVLLVVLGQVDSVNFSVSVALIAAVSDVDVLLAGLRLSSVNVSGSRCRSATSAVVSAATAETVP